MAEIHYPEHDHQERKAHSGDCDVAQHRHRFGLAGRLAAVGERVGVTIKFHVTGSANSTSPGLRNRLVSRSAGPYWGMTEGWSPRRAPPLSGSVSGRFRGSPPVPA